MFYKLCRFLAFFMPVKIKTKIFSLFLYRIGKNSQIFTNSIGTEPYLIKIGSNVNVAAGVRFITHDISCQNITRLIDYKIILDSVGSIVINDNAFIGAYTIILPNTQIGKNSIIAAGSVITKNVPENEVWGGVPAKFLMSIEEYKSKLIKKNINFTWVGKDKKSAKELRKVYFFKENNH